MLVVHELFGVTAHIREVCERVAALGIVALAPDLYHRTEPGADLPHDEAGRERGFALLERLRREEAVADLRAAADLLRQAGTGQVGVLGLSLGGHAAYLAATQLDLDPVVALYPGWLTGTEIGLSRPEPTLTLTGGIRGRTLVLVGEDDHAVAEHERHAIGDALTAGGTDHELIVYPDTPHGFLCDRRDTYRPEAALDAWARIEALLRTSWT